MNNSARYATVVAKLGLTPRSMTILAVVALYRHHADDVRISRLVSSLDGSALQVATHLLGKEAASADISELSQLLVLWAGTGP